MEPDVSKWSGEGDFTQALIDVLKAEPRLVECRVEDAPATRSDADYNFISNEIYIKFDRQHRREPTRRFGFLPGVRMVPVKSMTLAELEAFLSSAEGIGPPDYSDEGMLQYLRAQRIIPAYQTRGYKLVELVRIYEVDPDRAAPEGRPTAQAY